MSLPSDEGAGKQQDEALESGLSAGATSEAALGLQDFEETVAERVEKKDPVATEVRAALNARIKSADIELPRQPDSAAKLLTLSKNADVPMKDILRHVRSDAALAGRLLEIANSASFAGSQRVYNLQMAIVRLGLTRVGEVAFEMSGGAKHFQRDKRSNMLARMWKYSQAVGFVCEELAERVPDEQAEGCFLTGLFHNVAGPLIVECIGRLERGGTIPAQSDSRVLGLLDGLAGDYTLRVVKMWNVPKTSREAIELQYGKVRARRRKPLAHLLVCAKAVAAELGMGVRPQPIDFASCRDFHFLGVEDATGLEAARQATIDKMIQITRH